MTNQIQNSKFKIKVFVCLCAICVLISINFYPSSIAAQGPASATPWRDGPIEKFLYPFSTEAVTAQAFAVLDTESGNVLIQRNSQVPWVPASLTKLVTAMVVLDQNPEFTKSVKMQKDDEVGGARIATKSGVAYRLIDLFFASLVASANNTTNAIARSVGLNKSQFVQKMNEKAKSLGANNSNFVEPTGIDPKNTTTALDYTKILKAALSYPKIMEAVQKTAYGFKSVNYANYKHNLKNTDVLLTDGSLMVVGGKTGYLEESGYNFAAEFKDVDGKNIIVVLFGSKNHQSQFFESKSLALWAWLNYKWQSILPQVAGAFIGLQMPVDINK